MTGNSRISREISQFLISLEQEGISHSYLIQHRCSMRAFEKYCLDQGVTAPTKVSMQTVQGFMRQYEVRSAIYQKINLMFVKKFLRFSKNPIANQLKFRIRGSSRTRVDWLSVEEIEKIFQTPMRPAILILIAGGALMGLRRIESLRITVRDVKEALQTGNLRVRGKGMKERVVPMQEDYREILRTYLARYEYQGEDEMILKFGTAYSWKLLKEFCKSYGKEFGFHTLRRSFGRHLWQHGVPLETISRILGHSNTQITEDYIGVNISDMQTAMLSVKYGARTGLKILST